MRKRIYGLIAAAVAVCLITGCSNTSGTTEKASADISSVSESASENIPKTLLELAGNAMLNSTASGYRGAYSVLDWDVNTSLPESYDLRDQGVITAVKNQNPFSTCWAFAAISACEGSILSELGLTTDEFKQKYGVEMDLSEKHLAYFANMHLPEADEIGNEENELSEQAGEGIYRYNGSGEGADIMQIGGIPELAVSVFSAGISPAFELEFPYANADGECIASGDWSIPEEERFDSAFEFQDGTILPSPISVDTDGNVTYRENAVSAIKEAIYDGNPVMVAYRGDQSTPEPSEEEIQITVEGYTNTIGDSASKYTEEQIYNCARVACFIQYAEEYTDDEIKVFAEIISIVNYGQDYTEEEYNTVYNYLAIPQTQYINTETFGQYVYDIGISADHAACIVGWDDSYSKDNFVEGHSPEGDGAWIVKNSWGTERGDNGYFYLSYYDLSASAFECFDFDTTRVEEALSGVGYPMTENLYDFLPPSGYMTNTSSDTIYEANIFITDTDSYLKFVSCATGHADTDVTYSVYKLNDNSANPTDGELLTTVTEHYKYAGYHRSAIAGNLSLGAGIRFSVVVEETTDDGDVLIGGYADSRNYLDGLAEKSYDVSHLCYGLAVCNEGESYIFFDDEWIDWADFKQAYEAYSGNLYTLDNPPVRMYCYPE